MKISNSKKELAKIIHENGGWRDGAEWSVQHKTDGRVVFTKAKYKPEFNDGCWDGFGTFYGGFVTGKALPNWHQTVLSRDEYFHLYPAPDADGWIEWIGGVCPVDDGALVDIRISSGKEMRGQRVHPRNWVKDGSFTDIISYRLHKQEIAPVAGVVPEPVVEAKPTIEQLAADYRNRKDYADRKQQEADAAKADADAKLAELVAAGKALGLVLSVADAPEPELVITDWRDLREGDEIRCTEGTWDSCFIGRIGVVEGVEDPSYQGDMPLRVEADGDSDWGDNFDFIRRPAERGPDA